MTDIPAIFGEALEIDTPDARAAYLRQACGDDIELRRQVVQLLEDHAAAGEFLEEPATADFILQEVVEGPGTQIGPYKIREKIGEGGMGNVYLADQAEPIRRRVALKLVKPGMDTRQVLARFEAERQTLAMMSHPNISKILDAGATESGRPYFVMELVKGIPITEFCNQQKLSVGQRLELFIQVCQAVQHAHQRGIIHRDLKPSNVLVELHDVTPVPKVIDFGIAKATGQQLSQHTIYTQFVQMIGTPLYMSPEQAQLSGLDIDTRSDVYSLGVLLYELLTGTTPFDQTVLMKVGPDEMRRIIREVDPLRPSHKVSTLNAAQLSTVANQRQVDPSTLSSSIEHELDWIILKAMEKDRERRYESASAMAADLQRYLDNEAVLACPPSLGYQIRKIASRNKALIATIGMVSLSLLIGTAVATWQAIIAKQERNRANQTAERVIEESRRAEEKTQIANQERLRAEAAELAQRRQTELAENMLYASAIQLANRYKESSDDEQASQLLDSWVPQTHGPDRRGIEWHLLQRQLKIPGDELLKLPGDVSCTRISPDGDYVVAATNQGLVQRYSLTASRVLTGWETGLVDVRRMEFSPDGKLLALISYEAEAVVIDTATGLVRLRCPPPAKPTKNADVCFVDGRLLTSGNGGLISIWNVEEFKLERTWTTECPLVLDMTAISAHGGLFLLADNLDLVVKARVLRIPRLDVGSSDHQMPLSFNPSTLAVSPDGRIFAVGNTSGDVVLWNSDKGQVFDHWQLTEKINELCFSPDGVYLAAAESTGVVHVREWQKGQSSTRSPLPEYHRHWKAHARPARTVVFTPESRHIITSGIDGRVVQWRNWDRPHSGTTIPLTPGSGRVCILHEARTVAVVDSHDLRLFDMNSGGLIGQQRLTDLSGVFSAITADDSGYWLACASGYSTGEILCGDLRQGTELKPLPESIPKSTGYYFLDFLPGTRTLVGIERRPALRICGWDVEQGQLQFEHHLKSVVPNHITLSRRSNELLVVTNQDVLRINATSGVIKARWPCQGHTVTAIAASHDGATLAIGRNDRTLSIVDAFTGQVLQTLRGHLSVPVSLNFSVDGRTLLALDDRGELRFWQVFSGSELLTWPARSAIRCFDLARDNQTFAVIHDDILDLYETGVLAK